MPSARFLLPGCLMVAMLAAPVQALAQEGTPAPAMSLPLCTAEPRDIDSLLALWFEPSGSPAATPAMAGAVAEEQAMQQGSRADDATVTAIADVTHEWLSCMEVAGQYARGFALLSDRLAQQFGPDVTDATQDSPEEVRALLEAQLAATPVPGAELQTTLQQFAGPRRTRLLDDGRVAAIWAFGGDRVLLVYQQQADGRWLIDEAIDILDLAGTPEATPAP